MASNSRFKLYNYTEALVYTFPNVQESNAPRSFTKSVVIEGLRGQGCIVIPGSTGSIDIRIRGFLMIDENDEGYNEITTKMDELIDTIPYNTRLTLRVYKDDSNYYTYRVKRVEPIQWGEGKRTNLIEYTVILKDGAWTP